MSAPQVNLGAGSGGIGTALLSFGIMLAGALMNFTNTPGPVLSSLSNANSPMSLTEPTIGSGDNTIAVPAGTGFIVLLPPSSNAQSIKLKNVGGDSGFALHPAAPHVFALPNPNQTSFVLNAGGSIPGFAILFL